MVKRIRIIAVNCIVLVVLLIAGCKKHGVTTTAFYYWKAVFQINPGQNNLLAGVNSKQLYIRFFDVNWHSELHRPYPNAIVNFKAPTGKFDITPVVYIANKTFENIADTSVNTLALHCNQLINQIAKQQAINYSKVQIDCDWTLTTRDKYFSFIKAFKKASRKQLQVTIRLHQVKYKERTGIPPVDTGVLMFYNMGSLNANLHQNSSIYNQADAEKYAGYLSSYPLKLDIALPAFSWALQIRDAKLIQVYGKITREVLSRPDFEYLNIKNCYRAKHSLFLDGIYVKQNDIFKLEETDANSLNIATTQLVKYLPNQQYRTILYYELANINTAKFKAETIKGVSDSF